MITLPSQCKFCGRSVAVNVDPRGAAMFGDLEDFVSGMLACNRCADLRNEISKTVAFIDRKKFDAHIPPDVKRELVSGAAQKFARRVCGFYQSSTQFQPDLVEMFLEKRAEIVARMYENTIRQQKHLKPLRLWDIEAKTTVERPAAEPAYMEAPEYTDKENLTPEFV